MLDLHNFPMPALKDGDCDRNAIRKEYLRQNGRIAVKNLQKNNFEAQYCDSVAEARAALLAMIPDGGVVAFGDSHTLFALELDEELAGKNCAVIPHKCAVNHYAMENNSPGFQVLGDKETMRDILMQYLVSNVFLLSANAVTIDGQIINIDGTGNRIAGSLYGPDRIIVVAGANKIVQNLEEGLERIRYVAAQMNNIKYHNDLACNLSGTCKECRNAERNCNITAILHKRPVDSDFHVIIIGEELGF